MLGAMHSHRLKLNAQKSEVIWLGTRQQLAKLHQADTTIHLPDGALTAKPTVRNLGVQLDSELSFDAQAHNCIKSCYYHLRRINQIKRYVDQECLRSLVHAFITSRLDYCNSLYAHCHISTRLQRVQNRAARFVLSAPPRSSSLPLLQQLHWLPIEARVSYKLCCLMYRVVHGAAPSYLTELCEPCLDTRLRSTSRGDFIIPRSNRHLADSSFSVAAPSAWNQLPTTIRNCPTLATFLTKLKAHLFTVSFSH